MPFHRKEKNLEGCQTGVNKREQGSVFEGCFFFFVKKWEQQGGLCWVARFLGSSGADYQDPDLQAPTANRQTYVTRHPVPVISTADSPVIARAMER